VKDQFEEVHRKYSIVLAVRLLYPAHLARLLEVLCSNGLFVRALKELECSVIVRMQQREHPWDIWLVPVSRLGILRCLARSTF
jgi:hypothetical protein